MRMESPDDTVSNRKNVAFRLLEQKIAKKNAAAKNAAPKKAPPKKAAPKKAAPEALAAPKKAPAKKAPPKQAARKRAPPKSASQPAKGKVNLICFFSVEYIIFKATLTLVCVRHRKLRSARSQGSKHGQCRCVLTKAFFCSSGMA